MSLTVAIPRLRESILAILRLRLTTPQSIDAQGNVVPGQVEFGWGSGFCVLSDKYIITAFHVLSGGNSAARNPAARFYALVVPGNGDPFYWFPITSFPLEWPDLDMAVLELGPCSTPGIHVPGLPVTFAPQPDGTQVITAGFPAPEVVGIQADPQGNFLGGHFFLKSHANEGIVAAQYLLAGTQPFYEFNVGWHHGESGGPVTTLADNPVAFTLMQHYRNVQGPNGPLAGPRRGIALSAIQNDLATLGVTGV